MKFILILTLSFLSYTKTAYANTCREALTPQKVQKLTQEVNRLQQAEQKRQNLWDSASLLFVCTFCPPLVFFLPIFLLFSPSPPPQSLNSKLAERFPKKEDFEAAQRHIQQLEEILGLPQKKAIRLALGWNPRLSFRNSTQSQELFEEVNHLTSRWGISKSTALQFIKVHQYIKQNTDEVLQEISRVLEEKGNFSKEETKKIIQSFRTINEYLIYNLSNAISTLSQAGFTNEQIISIMKLDVVRTDESVVNFNLFHRENTSLKEKREKLRQAGFTEEEINRIPVHVLQRTKAGATKSTLFWSYLVAGHALILDGLQWIFTSSSFIW